MLFSISNPNDRINKLFIFLSCLQIIFRQMLAHARWRAEREFPSQWGGHKLNINIGERSATPTSDALLEKDAKALVAQIAIVE